MEELIRRGGEGKASYYSKALNIGVEPYSYLREEHSRQRKRVKEGDKGVWTFPDLFRKQCSLLVEC